MSLEPNLGFLLICKAKEKENEERLFTRWVHENPYLNISFEEYKKALTPYRKSTNEEKEEILKKYGGI